MIAQRLFEQAKPAVEMAGENRRKFFVGLGRRAAGIGFRRAHRAQEKFLLLHRDRARIAPVEEKAHESVVGHPRVEVDQNFLEAFFAADAGKKRSEAGKRNAFGRRARFSGYRRLFSCHVHGLRQFDLVVK